MKYLPDFYFWAQGLWQAKGVFVWGMLIWAVPYNIFLNSKYLYWRAPHSFQPLLNRKGPVTPFHLISSHIHPTSLCHETYLTALMHGMTLLVLTLRMQKVKACTWLQLVILCSQLLNCVDSFSCIIESSNLLFWVWSAECVCFQKKRPSHIWNHDWGLRVFIFFYYKRFKWVHTKLEEQSKMAHQGFGRQKTNKHIKQINNKKQVEEVEDSELPSS